MCWTPVVRERYPLLADAERLIADPLVRNMGTVGGALAHADPAEDLPAAFMALGCEVVVRGPDGERTIAHRRAVRRPLRDRPGAGEIMTEIRVPARSGRERLLQGQAPDRRLRRRRRSASP